MVFVAAADHDGGVEGVADAAHFDGVGDQFAGDQGGLHALGAHGDAVGDGNGVDLHGCAAGFADALHDFLGELAVGVVAGHGADPGVGDHDERAAQVVGHEADGVELGASGGAVGAVDEHGAALA